MTQVATAPQLEMIRKNGQAAKLYVAALTPAVVYSARLNGLPTLGTDLVAEITYDGGSGTLAEIKAGMTLYVGTSPGGQELGTCRIRKSPTSTIMYIGEQSLIVWVDNCYLTVVLDYELWPKHVHITEDGSVQMDYDVDYVDQHSNFLPVPIMGGHVVKKLTGETVTVQLGPESGTSSYVYGSTISARLWEIPGADSIATPTAASTTAVFSAEGWYPVYHTVTAANGRSKTGMRWVYIWSDEQPPLAVEEISFREDAQEGGHSFELTVSGDANLTQLYDRTLCILFAVDYFEGLEDQVGFILGQENIVGVGRIVSPESLVFGFNSSRASFTVESAQGLFKRITGFPSGVEMKNTPTVWTDMPALTVARALWHLLEWRCTATEIMDVLLPEDTRYASELSSPLTYLWDQMQEIAFTSILASAGIDAHGRLFIQVDALLIPESSKTYPLVMTVEKQDIHSYEINRATETSTSQVVLSGVAVTLGGDGKAYFSLSPGHIFSRVGSPVIIDRLLLASQAQANELAGLLFSSKNNPYSLKLEFSGNNRLVTCFPNQAIYFTVEADDNVRGFEIAGRYIPRRRSIAYDPQNFVITSEVEFEYETSAAVAINGDVPGSGDLSAPPPFPKFPPMPSLPPLLSGLYDPTVLDGGHPRWLMVDRGSTSVGLVYTANFDNDRPDYYTVNAGLTADQYKNINKIIQCPSGAIYVASVRGHADAFVARADGVGGTFEILWDNDIKESVYPGVNNVVLGLGYNPLLPETVMFVTVGPANETGAVHLGVGGTFSITQELSNVIAPGSITWGLDQWLFTPMYWSFGPNAGGKLMPASADSFVPTPVQPGWYTNTAHQRLGTSGYTLHHSSNSGILQLGTNNLTTLTDIGTVPLSIPTEELAMTPDGQFMMTGGYGSANKGKTSDRGYTWVDIASLPYVGNIWVFRYDSGKLAESRWVAGSSYIYYSKNFGGTWVSKQGNMPYLSPFYQITNILKIY